MELGLKGTGLGWQWTKKLGNEEQGPKWMEFDKDEKIKGNLANYVMEKRYLRVDEKRKKNRKKEIETH